MPPEQPNILLIVLDAVRQDHLSTYGYDRPTDPCLSNLSENSYVYENAFANSNWTPTSHAAFFTGLLPSQSGVYGQNLTIPSEHRIVPEYLKEKGYRTFATAAGAHIRSERGFGRGFDQFHETYRIQPSKDFLRTAIQDPDTLSQLAFSLIKGHDNYTHYKIRRLTKWIAAGEDPFFAFVNFKTAHHPYNPPRPYKSQFSDIERPIAEFVEMVSESLGRQAQSIPNLEMDRLTNISQNYPLIADDIDPTKAEIETIEAWYDGAIRYLDDRISQILDFLSSDGYLDDTYVIITADHGEQFGDHGRGKHRYSLYDELLQVPLIIRTPAKEGKQINEMVSLIDLFPTLLSLAGSTDEQSRVAKNLLVDEIGHDYLFAEVGRKPTEPVQRDHPSFTDDELNGPLQSVRSTELKLIRRYDQYCELYDWQSDPDEQTDLSKEHPQSVESLCDVLSEYLNQMGTKGYSESITDSQLQSQLEDLGYL